MAGADLSNPALYDQASLEQKLTFLNQQLGAIGLAAQQAKARGDTADLQAILADFRIVMQRAATLTGQVNQAQAPSAFAQALVAFDNAAGNVARGVAQPFVDAWRLLDDTINGTRKVVKWLPYVLVAVVVLVGAILYRARSISASGVSR